MPATLAAALADATATLKAENDRAFEQSPLSPAEIQLAREIAPKGAEMWAAYKNALSRARRAQDALRVALCKGLAPFAKGPDGRYDPASAIANYNTCRLIDDYCEANERLYRAAQTLCDCLELADDGHEEGVEWSLLMAMRTRR